MARDFPISNGNVLINFDLTYNIRDIYYPRIGMENHALDHLSHFGVWCPEGFCWIDDRDMIKDASYWEDSLVTNVACRHDRFGLRMQIQDGIDAEDNVMIRKVKVRNGFDRERTVKLYFHLDLHIYGTAIGDTVFYDPDINSLVFYKGHRYMSLSCCAAGQAGSAPSSYATGQKEIHGLEGTWRDAQDGQLGRYPISQGSVDGTIELELKVPANGESEGWFWVCFGTRLDEIYAMERRIRAATPQARLQRTGEYWAEWVRKDKHELNRLSPEIAACYKRSLLLIRTNMDNGGAIIAANDSDILKFNKDTYSYMWPRDGALISHALDRAGYHDLTRRFFDFCKAALSKEGCLLHKYNADGSLGSSWHPWVNAEGQKQLPIQEDETALVLYTLWHHHVQANTLPDSADDYERLVRPAADFVAGYMDESGLPLPSYDLWEERHGVFSFTVASVYAGLLAAGNFAEYHGDPQRASHYRDRAALVQKAAQTHLYSDKEGRFGRGLIWNAEKKTYELDASVDACLYALFDFGLIAADDPRMVRTMDEVKRRLWVQTDIGGLARYENDFYHQVSKDIGKVPGNPWFICTLWYAEWLIDKAKSEQELAEPESLIRWAVTHALKSGVMAEQINPYTADPLSVSPLTWSHATFIKVVQEYLSKLKSFAAEPRKKEDMSEQKVLEEVR
ncbi:glucan 1,4-alpha-glucosidase [Gordoniibacillus kamchatkensis]|uniref:Glucan 1,4-alpha-glucosidase n=1 Tax=Gordoniibacillus kamchatkensis TaxID=1590651 RepID=A0ABR5AFI6_9BACL|nr:glycoside hydrolase family 15 protein [Paenibacillus sp. VKM B-2647]KIL39823.1 glucan 1,4-alpha-glucosidase [Paenibacillus sp. VKM B-2647]